MKKNNMLIGVLLAFCCCLIVASFAFFPKDANLDNNVLENGEKNHEKIVGVIEFIESFEKYERLHIIGGNGNKYVVNVQNDTKIEFLEFSKSEISVGGLIEVKYNGVMTKSLPPILNADSLIYYPKEIVTTGKVLEIGEMNGYKRFLIEGENSLCYVTVTNDTIISGNLSDVKIDDIVTYTSIIQLLSYPGQCAAIHFIVW
ncbi:conserved hypothetical protein [Methanococcus vannielii SB]|uniref:Uncharacterized protein n=1 Tax=Methanococcus vannielii (strain ATCC 35089 / DSM 1224 / JCM 13029 / OCM 148 / SB) TaxID=406327 RepID=A6USN0_METVS|nr:hypothetical protein [Methanococcus vannielii]ABR55502.1 conserved hypothetical protein [Methanococcus vannielii SB]